ncbi:MAG: SIS domain-containing protein [Kiritimatiellae bacterium]|nr:SIS domain-containing protein [Kiritimatiellia bacterium]
MAERMPPAWIAACLTDSLACIEGLRQQVTRIDDAIALLVDTLKSGHQVLTAGNGGSAAEAMHMAEELVGRFRTNRRSLPAVALTADGTALTCIGNDFGFDSVFSRQIEGLGRAGDLLVLYSTSGRAANLTGALEAARARRMRALLILGRDGGSLAGQGDVEIIVAGAATEHIQEAHQVLLHILLEAVERAFPD